jgi:hypothetical protein
LIRAEDEEIRDSASLRRFKQDARPKPISVRLDDMTNPHPAPDRTIQHRNI